MKSKIKVLGIAALLAAVLSACGGGGGGSDTTNTTVTTTTPSPTTSTTVSIVAPATYATASEEAAAFNLLNTERSTCGFGKLAQNAQLDAAAKAHADYQIINNLISHYEDASLYPTGFTGVFPTDRVVAQGYTGAALVGDEISVFSGSTFKTGLGASGIRGLLNAPYHLKGMVTGLRDIGVSVRSSADDSKTSNSVFVQVDLAYKTSDGPQLLDASDVKTYPCDGTTGVNRQLTEETPNPVPGRDLSTSPLGSSIYIAARQGNTLAITSASMVNVSTGAAVVLRTANTSTNDPYAGCSDGACYQAYEAYVAADAPLVANTKYQATITGTNNGTAFSRTFTFSTGS